jgi:long-chain fatty acid transport protein
LLTNISINPAAAWQVWPNFSIGAGLTINYAAVNLRSGLVWPSQPHDQFRFKGYDWDVGYNFGALWRPHEKVSLGVAFRSGNDYDLEGHAEYFNKVPFPRGAPLIPAFSKQHVAAEAGVSFPLNVVVGLSFRPTPKWNLEFDADYTDWTTLDNVTIKQAHGFGSLLPKNIPAVLDWEGAWYCVHRPYLNRSRFLYRRPPENAARNKSPRRFHKSTRLDIRPFGKRSVMLTSTARGVAYGTCASFWPS